MSTILVVDDMATYREPISGMLRRQGYTTKCAANGAEALSLVQAAPPDLILLDVAMPHVDGLTVLKTLRQNPVHQHIPVIMLTAAAEKEHVLEATRLGAQGYLLKSNFSLEELMNRVKEVLANPVSIPVSESAALEAHRASA